MMLEERLSSVSRVLIERVQLLDLIPLSPESLPAGPEDSPGS